MLTLVTVLLVNVGCLTPAFVNEAYFPPRLHLSWVIYAKTILFLLSSCPLSRKKILWILHLVNMRMESAEVFWLVWSFPNIWRKTYSPLSLECVMYIRYYVHYICKFIDIFEYEGNLYHFLLTLRDKGRERLKRNDKDCLNIFKKKVKWENVNIERCILCVVQSFMKQILPSD